MPFMLLLARLVLEGSAHEAALLPILIGSRGPGPFAGDRPWLRAPCLCVLSSDPVGRDGGSLGLPLPNRIERSVVLPSMRYSPFRSFSIIS